MGRTQRNRRRKKPRNFITCDGKEELIFLNSWLAKQEMRCNRKLVLAIFDDTGRGVLAKKKIYAGEELMNLPLNMTLNVTTVLMDFSYCSLFLDNSKQCLVEYKRSMSFQCMLAFYLVFLKVQGEDSKWHVYIESLPKEYTVPYFLPNNLKLYLDSNILDVVTKQKEIIDSSFHIFEEILNHTESNFKYLIKLKETFKLDIYEWAYFTVNTRCVFMDLSNIIDLNNVGNSILNLINDNTKISLCPYLDMINHSPDARNETKLMVGRNLKETLKVDRLNEDLFSDVWFSIYTKNNFEKFSQVFICYGDSHNLKLVTEYGFYLPNNDLDSVPFSFEDVISFLKIQSVKLSQEQIAFINSHGLNKNLYIDSRGLSYNFYGLLMVVKYFYNKTVDVSRLIYSAAVCSDDKLLNELIKPMVIEKLEKMRGSLEMLEMSSKNCVVLNNCILLMCRYVSILEKFIKC